VVGEQVKLLGKLLLLFNVRLRDTPYPSTKFYNRKMPLVGSTPLFISAR
jgi:hypothetical protein